MTSRIRAVAEVMSADHPASGTLQVAQDGATPPVIAPAGIGKVSESIGHRPHLGDLGPEFPNMIDSDEDVCSRTCTTMAVDNFIRAIHAVDAPHLLSSGYPRWCQHPGAA